MKKLNFAIFGMCLLILNGCTNNYEQSSSSSWNTNSISSEKKSEDSSAKGTSDDNLYPKISKELLNGKSWYEGSSSNVSNQPREGFNASKFYDLFGNSLDYEIIVSDTEKKYSIMDSVKNEIVPITISTEIKVRKPGVSGIYGDVYFPLYYKYDGTLMIARRNTLDDNYDFISYPLEDISLSNIENKNAESKDDLDVNAINNGDFTSLVGTWTNGNKDVLIINSDGSTNIDSTIHGVKNSDTQSKIPFASLRSNSGVGGAALALFKIGFKNPDGDNSDTTKSRILITQQGGSYPAKLYYYKQ